MPPETSCLAVASAEAPGPRIGRFGPNRHPLCGL